jgi:hypothetical protein
MGVADIPERLDSLPGVVVALSEVGGTPRRVDSVFTQVRFAPIGSPPPITMVQITSR